jgi:nucleoside phosphorylase
VLVCFAVREEARFFAPPEIPSRFAAILITGIGPDNAATAFRGWLAHRTPALVLTCGFAGGLEPRLGVGALVFTAEPAHPMGVLLLKAGAVPCRFHSANRVAVTAREKRTLREQTGADAVEMESGIIQQICHSRGIPCVTLRVISDTAGQDLPLDFNGVMTPQWQLSYAKLGWAVLKDFRRIPALLLLQRRTQAAARLLGATLEALLRDYWRAAG